MTDRRANAFESLATIVGSTPGAAWHVEACDREAGCEVFHVLPEHGAGAHVQVHLFEDGSGVLEIGEWAQWGIHQCWEEPDSDTIETAIRSVAAGDITVTRVYTGETLQKVEISFGADAGVGSKLTDYMSVIPTFLRRGKRRAVTETPPAYQDERPS